MKTKVSGFKEAAANLALLGNNATARRVGERALRKAAEPVRDEAKRLAPDDPETGSNNFLRASIKIGRAATQIRRAGNSGNRVTVYIGIDGSVLPPKPSSRRKTKKGSARTGGGVAAYSIFVEMGSKSHAAQPFMRPAWEAKKQVALDRLADDVRAEVEKTMARAARKAAR